MDPADQRTLDDIAADATPAPIAEEIAGWRCTAAPDLPFRRANVVRPPTGAGLDPVACRAALGAVRAWCADRPQRLIVQVSSADPDAAQLDRVLAEEGLLIEAPVHLMVAPIPPPAAHPRSTATVRSATVRTGVDERWAVEHAAVADGGADHVTRTAAYGRMLAPMGDRALAATVADDAGVTVGLGFGVLDRGWVGIFGMATSPSHRRQGVATAILDALATTAAGRGVTHAYLQVETDNAAAIACYERLGFEISHGYHYRAEGADPDQGC